MTCIIALKHENRIYMGSDSAITIYRGLLVNAEHKIKRHSNCLVGFSGPKSVQNLMLDRDKVFEGSFNNFHLNEIWKTLIECTPANSESELLIATNKQEIFWIGNIASHRKVMEEFECTGNGAQVAKGAMEMSKNHINDPNDRILKALEISSKYCVGVREPFKTEYI